MREDRNMKPNDEAGTLFHAGRLAEALAAAGAAVRAAPADLGARVLLAELLLFAGNLERADVILDAASQIDPSAMMVVAEFRQLLRAETARRQLYREGRVPEFLGEPSPSEQASLKAMVALREGDLAGAKAMAAQAEDVRPRAAGTARGMPFDDFRDANDLLPGLIETLTTNGKYYWVPVARIQLMIFHPPRRPRDLAWRRCSMTVQDGPDGEVYVPATYYAAADTISDALRLGRETAWSDDSGPVIGTGQREFLIGDEAFGIMDLETIEFEP
jgi:type VI secretion system protein ImpE